jgi:hypothetical protein
MSKLEFTIRRDPNKTDPEGVEYWVYEDVVGVVERGNYLIVRTKHTTAIIPKWWIVAFKEDLN